MFYLYFYVPCLNASNSNRFYNSQFMWRHQFGGKKVVKNFVLTNKCTDDEVKPSNQGSWKQKLKKYKFVCYCCWWEYFFWKITHHKLQMLAIYSSPSLSSVLLICTTGYHSIFLLTEFSRYFIMQMYKTLFWIREWCGNVELKSKSKSRRWFISFYHGKISIN